jgi:cytochrome c556
MKLKWTVLVTVLTGTALALSSSATPSPTRQDESPLMKLMEQVNKTHNSIRSAVRTPVAYKKAGTKAILEDAEELLNHSKQARGFTEPAKTQKKTQKEWETLTDAMIKSTSEFIEVIKADKGQTEARKSFTPVTKSCSDCHAVFRVDEDF